MDQGISSVNEALEGRIGLMRELADSLERAQAAVLGSHIAQLRAQTKRQRELCEQWRLVSEIAPGRISSTPAGRNVANSHDADIGPAGERQRALLLDLAEVVSRLSHLNRAYGALLRRARRTVDIFCRVLENSGVTYTHPPLQPVSPSQPPSIGSTHV
ncbi:MAG TPA: hypothetical protein VEH30_10730 [Terriglobales bacterium]|nr:hypothetical protein [Terriglobales bacterium]